MAKLVCAVCAVCAAIASGCTLVGAGVGATVDAVMPGPFEPRAPSHRYALERGDEVILGMHDGTAVRGSYVGVHGPTRRDPELYLLVARDDSIRSVPASRVRRVAVEVSGKGWLYGGLVGLGLDVATIVIVGALFEMDLQLQGSESGCFC